MRALLITVAAAVTLDRATRTVALIDKRLRRLELAAVNLVDQLASIETRLAALELLPMPPLTRPIIGGVSGWTCSGCGAFVVFGTQHTCGGSFHR